MLLQADTNDDVASKISSWLKDVEVRGFVKYFAYNDGDSESDYEEEPEDDDNSLEASSHQYLGESKQIALVHIFPPCLKNFHTKTTLKSQM